MGDQRSRKYAAVSRLRTSLQRKRESLADQFEFKIYVSIHFYCSKDKKTKSALFECSEILPVMTNNYEQCIMEGVKNDAYSLESSRELINKDIVQFHTHNWRPLRKDMPGSKSAVDFLLWPRTDIESIQCHLFSRWKDDDGPFRQIDAQFVIQSCEYEPQLKHLVSVGKTSGLLTVNREQTTFLFVDKHYFKLDKGGGPKAVLTGQDNVKRLLVFRLRSLCLYLPQDSLMAWGPGTAHDWVASHLLAAALGRKSGKGKTVGAKKSVVTSQHGGEVERREGDDPERKETSTVEGKAKGAEALKENDSRREEKQLDPVAEVAD